MKEDETAKPGLFSPSSRRFWLRILAGFGIAAAAGSVSGYLLTIDIPRVSRLEDYRPPIGTKIYSDVGEVLYEFAGQKRILIRYEQIPEVLRTAIIATEDSRFYHHFGIDPRSILRAAIKDVLSLRFAQGASTITQQLARNLFLQPDKTVWRKVQEAVLALQIEKVYTKEEILEFYCNQIYMGHGRYGLEAASRLYHGKHAADLTLAEAALLAGILQRPEALSPFRHPERALRKRDHVLNRMVKEGYLTREDFEIHSKEPLVLPEPQETKNIAPYFVERIRQDLEKRYGGKAIYGGGMEVYSTLNMEMQAAANEAVLKGLRALDKRQGYRGPIRNLLDEDSEVSLDEYEDEAWEEEIETGSILPGLVTKVGPDGADIRIGEYRGQVSREGFGWTKEIDPQNLFHIGDLSWFLVEKIDREKGLVHLSLEQEPVVEGAL
ncbi:MAG: transglycosylase domain-containing protein, partial [Acidobacteria bacterium]|nr:transglycosylase domain-containing protein [Acidobacteriota bacterium]